VSVLSTASADGLIRRLLCFAFVQTPLPKLALQGAQGQTFRGARSVALAIDLGRCGAHREMPARILSVARLPNSLPVIPPLRKAAWRP